MACGNLAGAQHILRRSEPLLQALRSYAGADDLVRQACRCPGDEDTQLRLADHVTANMQSIMQFYAFSTDIAGIAQQMTDRLAGLTADSEDADVVGGLILFCFEFDQLKASTPSLQNDVSYYRRVLSTGLRSNVASVGAGANRNSGIVSPDNAHVAAMWLAQSGPMMSSLSSLSCGCIRAVGDICAARLQKIPAADTETVYQWLRIWTACIILFDRNSPAPGAFTKTSPVKVYPCMLSACYQLYIMVSLLN
jgi:hypothetical protein